MRIEAGTYSLAQQLTSTEYKLRLQLLPGSLVGAHVISRTSYDGDFRDTESGRRLHRHPKMRAGLCSADRGS